MALLMIAPEWISFMGTFDSMRLVPRDPDDLESEKVPLLSYGALNPERAQDRKKCPEWDQRLTKDLRKEFGRDNDHSTYHDALMRLWAAFRPTKPIFGSHLPHRRRHANPDRKQHRCYLLLSVLQCLPAALASKFVRRWPSPSRRWRPWLRSPSRCRLCR